MGEDGTADEGATHNDFTGSVSGGAVYQGRDMYFYQVDNAPADSTPAMSGYAKALESSIESALKETRGKQLVVMGADAVLAVRRWAETAGGGCYRGRTVEIDLGESSWREKAHIVMHHYLVLLSNARDLDAVREFWEEYCPRREVLMIVATPHELAETDWVRILRTPADKERHCSFGLLPSDLYYSLFPSGIALAIGIASTVVVLMICASNSMPDWAVIMVGVLTAAIAAAVGYGIGRFVRARIPPTRGRLTVGPDGIQVQAPTGMLELHWSAVEFAAVVPTRHGVDVLLVKAAIEDHQQEPMPLDARDLGIVGLCLVGVAGVHCDLRAVRHSRDDVLAALAHYWTGPVIQTREELLARERGLRDRI